MESLMDEKTIRLEYDVGIEGTIDGVNELLKPYGLSFSLEDEYHDGFEILILNDNITKET